MELQLVRYGAIPGVNGPIEQLPRRVSLKAPFPLWIGRESGSHRRPGRRIGIDNRFTEISRYHCSIYPTPGGLVIVDEGSANGTAVNNIRLVKGARTLLKVDDEVVLGFPNASTVAGGGRLDRKQRDGACVVFRIVAAPNGGMAGPGAANARAETAPQEARRGEGARETGLSKKRKRGDKDARPETKGRDTGDGEEEDETQDRKVHAKEEPQDEGQADEAIYTALRCPICLDAPAAAAHMSCGHTVCFTCMHARFFHQNIEDASAHGFPDRVRQCPIDRKSVTHVCRSLLVDALVDELNARPCPIVSPEDRPSWDARRREGAQLATYYEARLRSNPRCFVALPSQYMVVISPINRHNVHDRASATCRHCSVPFGERELRVTWKIMNDGKARYCHVACLRDALLARARERTPVHLLTRLTVHCVPPARGWVPPSGPINPSNSAATPEVRDLTEAAAQLRRVLVDPCLALPWWVLGPIDLRGPLFAPPVPAPPPPQGPGGLVIEVQSDEEEDDDEEEEEEEEEGGEGGGMPAVQPPGGQQEQWEDEEEEEDEDEEEEEEEEEDDGDDDEELDEHALAMWREVLHNGLESGDEEEGGEEEEEEDDDEEEEEEENGIMDAFGLRGLYMFGQEGDEDDEDDRHAHLHTI